MKGNLYFILLLLTGCVFFTPVQAQQKQDREYLFRVYIDNDYINFRGKGTDQFYTNGLRFDLFYSNRKRPKWLPTAGDSSINVTGWSIMQMAITPRDIKTTEYQPDDYPYSGALFATYSQRSYNPQKKYGLQTELLLGVMGPAALGEQGQKLIHQLISYQLPMGWEHQLGNALLANVQFIAEKQLAAIGHWAEIIGGSKIAAGTMTNSATIYPLIRIGLMHPYFSGNINQLSSPRSIKGQKKWQAYLVARPGGSFTLTNALLTGGISNSYNGKIIRTNHPLQKFTFNLEYGAVVSKGRVALSVTQRYTTPMLKGLYSHEVGNVSLSFNW